ncbi:homogentisate phytyltransferase [Salix suchowensis]|nr:homogentisate phytyltransferase [Salix suchowensis]
MVSLCSSSCFSLTTSRRRRQDGLVRNVTFLEAQRSGKLRITCDLPQSRRLEALSIHLASTVKKIISIQDFQQSFIKDFQDGISTGPENENVKDTVIQLLHSFYQFSRPHTVIGTLIGITLVSLLPVETISDLSPTFFMGLLKALVPSVLMNIYVVGLNQLFDVEIDKVNKPYLPLASGDFSMGTGVAIVSASLLTSFAMGIMFQSPPLLSALLISCVLGSVYSIELPLLRWKKQAFLAAICIMVVRAIVVQLAFFVHMQRFVLGKTIAVTRSLLFATAFMCFFSAVIALFKDIPDVDGDRDFGIQSFSVSFGQERDLAPTQNQRPKQLKGVHPSPLGNPQPPINPCINNPLVSARVSPSSIFACKTNQQQQNTRSKQKCRHTRHLGSRRN